MLQDHTTKCTTYLSRCFREMMQGVAYIFLAQDSANKPIAGTLSIQVPMLHGKEGAIFTAGELELGSQLVVDGLCELFQGRAIAAWHDLLTDIFRECATEHLAGRRKIPGLKKQSLTVDFGNDRPVQDQLLEALVRDFAFLGYERRIQIINNSVGPVAADDALEFIHKHVQIRNSFQHHSGRHYHGMLKQPLKVTNAALLTVEVPLGDRIPLAAAELELLRSKMHDIMSQWVLSGAPGIAVTRA